jgi:hypothetical protein
METITASRATAKGIKAALDADGTEVCLDESYIK